MGETMVGSMVDSMVDLTVGSMGTILVYLQDSTTTDSSTLTILDPVGYLVYCRVGRLPRIVSSLEGNRNVLTLCVSYDGNIQWNVTLCDSCDGNIQCNSNVVTLCDLCDIS